MSSVTPSRPSSAVSRSRSHPLSLAKMLVASVRAVSFWTAALLPLAVLASLATGYAGQHLSAVVGALALNAVCAVVGHGHAPRDRA